MVKGGGVAVGASGKSAGSWAKKTSSLRGRCDDCGEKGQKWRAERGGDGVLKRSQQSQNGSRSSDSGSRFAKPWSISSEKSKVVSVMAVSQGPS